MAFVSIRGLSRDPLRAWRPWPNWEERACLDLELAKLEDTNRLHDYCVELAESLAQAEGARASSTRTGDNTWP